MAIINELQNLGNAVRERTSTTALLTMNEMADKVRKIPYPQTDTITITANGTYSAPTGIDGYSKVDVNVEPTLESITITKNGTYTPSENIDGYNEIIVNTPVPVEPVIQEIEITENGTYSATDGVDGYNPIIVNVPTGGGGDIEVEPIVLTGQSGNICGGKIGSAYIKLFGDSITTSQLTSLDQMFSYYELEEIPFDINTKTGYGTFGCKSMFEFAEKLKTLPKIKGETTNFYRTFYSCSALRNIPKSFYEDINPQYLGTRYDNAFGYAFVYCSSLREIPFDFLSMTGTTTPTYFPFQGAFQYCRALKELVLPIYMTNTYTGNQFSNIFRDNFAMRRFVFETPDGIPAIRNWKNQYIDLTSKFGYGGIYTDASTDLQMKDDASYQQNKNNEYSWSASLDYALYNHDSAVETINSLPDCSSSGGTNTIRFYGASGALTDGGAINTLTEEEIAIATAKAWTVSFL